MSDFIAVGKTNDFPERGVLEAEVDGRYIIIVRLEDGFHCIDDLCTHDGGPLGEGELIGNCIACPRHGAQFDVRTGQATSMPATEPTFSHEVKVENGEILVKLAPED